MSYSKKSKDYLEKHKFCVVRKPGCMQVSNEVHHYYQYRTGDALKDERQFVPTCSSCHRWIHANPDNAREAGWLATREEKAWYVRQISRWNDNKLK